jgi:hypothetical protein
VTVVEEADAIALLLRTIDRTAGRRRVFERAARCAAEHPDGETDHRDVGRQRRAADPHSGAEVERDSR